MRIEASTVFCDDIRREDNGKVILIGVYTEALVPGKMPSRFTLSAWIVIMGIDAGKYPFSAKFTFPGVEETLEMGGEIEVADTSVPVSLFMFGFPAQVRQAGFIGVELDVNGELFDAGKLVVREPREAQT